MSDSQQDLVSNLERQIALLTAELERVKRKSDSLWNRIHDAFIDEGNTEEDATFWADKVSELISGWVISQRSVLERQIISTGEMPPYTNCLNDLSVAVTPPGALPPSFPELQAAPPSLPQPAPPSLPPPPERGLSADAQPGPPRMKRVNVPRAIPGAVPLPLPLDSNL